MPASELVASLREIGSDTLLKFLQRQLATDDPDLRPARPDGEQRRASALDRMNGFILSHARELLRATDADAVEAATTADSIMWRTAVSELRSLVAPAQAVASIKSDIAATALRRHSSQREQTALAASLWRIAGAEEKEYLTNWFYGLMPRAVQDGPEGFLRAVDHESRPDTQALLAAIVADARFAYIDWSTLRQLLHTVSTTLTAPLVELQAIYDNMPNSNRRDQSATLSKWRNTLRAHYDQPALPVPSPPLKPQSVLASPEWAVPYTLYPTISADGRLLAAHVPGQRKLTLLEAATGKLLREKAVNESGWWVAAAFARDNPRRLFLFASHDGQREALNVDDLTVVQRDRERYASQDTVVNRALTRAVTPRVRFPSLTCTNLTTGTQLWAVQDDGPGEGSPVAISSEGKFVAVGGRGWPHLVRIYDGENGTLRRDITEFAGTVTSLAFSPDSRWLAVASQGEGVGLWDVTTGQLLRHLTYPIGDSAHLHGLAISDDGRWLAAVGMPSRDHPAGVFNIATGELSWEIHSKVHLNGLLFSPNGNVLYTYGQLNTADHPLVEAWPLK